MTPEEQNLIEGLFQRLREADTSPKDAEAERLIRAKTAELPSATYLLVQAVLVQEHALANAQARIADLENRLRNVQAQPASGGGSFLSGVSRFSATNLNRRRRRLLCHSKRQYHNRFNRHLHQLRWFLKPRRTLQR